MKTVLIPPPVGQLANRECVLADCAANDCAVVLDLRCPAGDACRLRALGVYEGARVTVVRTQPGLLIEVRRTRLALGSALADAIDVMPLAAGG